MKIYDITKVYGVYETQPVTGRPAQKASSTGEKDKLMLSKDAVDFQTVMKGLKDVPDVRAAKVAEYTEKYNAGTHLADTRDIAEALFKSGAVHKNI